MDTSVIIISLIIGALCALPFILSSLSSRKARKEFLKRLHTIAGADKYTLNECELCNNTAIGLDSRSRTLFVLRKVRDQEVTRRIELSEFTSCMVIVSGPSGRRVDDDPTAADRIELSFIRKDGKKSDSTVEFFNVSTDIMLSGEYQLAHKWEKIIRSCLRPDAVEKAEKAVFA